MMAMVPIWPYAKWFKDNRWQGLWMKGGGGKLLTALNT
jgi:hypothetical protein